MLVETVEIVNKNAKSGFTRINKSDFNKDEHELYNKAPKGADKKSEDNDAGDKSGKAAPKGADKK